MAGMNEQALGRVIPWVAALFIGIASEFFPIVGMLAAALVFPQGIHSGHAYASMSLNFAVFFTATLYIFRFFIRRRYRTISK
jgi:hypothetical protein